MPALSGQVFGGCRSRQRQARLRATPTGTIAERAGFRL